MDPLGRRNAFECLQATPVLTRQANHAIQLVSLLLRLVPKDRGFVSQLQAGRAGKNVS